ncbi:dTDP-glucose 4,6-dehydratase [Pigmentiphaga sp. H8]|uniref:dTDP-glucose 4,6-dehydratase n=1 Tax=unclassified Pigmentiphaga TaxID=2626614 RepID=UPI000F5A1973|nr:dTDP-glucose 4,6-dehydratase [Pigmentiphaga sp. H8]AZG07250.1 dTDP-glucose 4,6-dehydratase [Pigmentiphaga sp. H8]
MNHVPRHVLVTGGAGFIGSNFVACLLAGDPGVRVVNLDLMTYAADPGILPRFDASGRHVFVHGDICDAALVDRLLRDHDVDTIVHFAAETHVDRSISGPGDFVRTNVDGTFVLLEAARQAWLAEGRSARGRRFHHISTDEVYGSLGPDDAPFTESSPYAPNSPYSASKAASDHLVRAYHRTYGLPVVTTHCSNNYGPYQHDEKFIPTIIRCCLAGEPIPVFGTGGNSRDWLYVDDHCRGIDRVLRDGLTGETYNIGGGCELNNIQVAEKLCALMDEHHPEGAPHRRLISFVADRPGHDWRYAIDAGKMREELGWEPAEDFDGAIRKTLAWYLTR